MLKKITDKFIHSNLYDKIDINSFGGDSNEMGRCTAGVSRTVGFD